MAELEDAAPRLRGIAAAARAESALLGERVPDMRRLAAAVATLIGGSATDVDTRLLRSIEAVLEHLTRSMDALQAASRHGESMAHDSLMRAVCARERLAVEQPYGRWAP